MKGVINIIIKKDKKIYLILCVICIILFMACGKDNKYVDIYNVVQEAFTTDKEYSNELSKHISEKVFNHINVYKVYAVNDKKYKEPFKVDFKLKENSQSKIFNTVYVQMTYSVKIKDSENKEVGGSWNVPIKFTVKKVNGAWYINDRYEEP
ncbi:hypothetical protein AGR56_06995 [Clostridium sp. DMHC 10]|uniref:hypothetical protein n=1 Tax=Clostridium sp. DMHC 10 TaxID=747377 RepID=UPI00069F1371|nr:hypothetical protein [Clostridium sp. DMHC 10]KOF56515.1 hypothetical protein AGR56_06995 [Clostridium sp. DMHC 10]